jgi:hypothetical protein
MIGNGGYTNEGVNYSTLETWCRMLGERAMLAHPKTLTAENVRPIYHALGCRAIALMYRKGCGGLDHELDEVLGPAHHHS